jgi:hypothetical protein
MDTLKIRMAADTVRRGWVRDRYHELVGDSCNVCMMGALALAIKPELAVVEDECRWQRVVDTLVQEDPSLLQALWVTAEGRRKDLTPTEQETHTKFVAECSTRMDRTIISVCHVNMAGIKDGEDAGAFLDQVAEHHAALSLLWGGS